MIKSQLVTFGGQEALGRRQQLSASFCQRTSQCFRALARLKHIKCRFEEFSKDLYEKSAQGGLEGRRL